VTAEQGSRPCYFIILRAITKGGAVFGRGQPIFEKRPSDAPAVAATTPTSVFYVGILPPVRRRLDVRPRLLVVLLALTAPAYGEPSASTAHWAFNSPVRPAVPAVRDIQRVRNPIDAFLLAKLEKAGLTFAPPADKRTLLRRVTFDLTGLPPTPAELNAFLGDDSPNAYARVVDRLLASPAFGERWAQHWLDVARYADTDGFESDRERSHTWRYRDYVIRSFNEDKGYDRFVTEQLAGDLLARTALRPNFTPGQKLALGPASEFIFPDVLREGVCGSDSAAAELLVAAGFNRLGPVHETTMNTPREVIRQEQLTEMTDAAGAVFLGLTVGCARCHDHKFDPIPQADYYRLQAFFTPAIFLNVDIASPAERAAADKAAKRFAEEISPIRKDLAALDKPYLQRIVAAKKALLEPKYREALAIESGKRTRAQKKLAYQAEVLLETKWDEIIPVLSVADRERRLGLRARLHDLEARRPESAPVAWTVADNPNVGSTRVLRRGDPLHPKEKVNASFPGALVAAKNVPDIAEPRRDRLELAQWLTRPDHPLTARVIANRLWHHHFGRGIVATPSDFGIRGEPPTHPELLDWLATELTARGWSLKHLHRLMVLSEAYQQSSRPVPQATRTIDPDNHLLSRMNRRRLEAETLRDATLATAGTLNPRRGGPFVRVPLEPEVYAFIFTEEEPDGLWPVHPDRREHDRRSIYLCAKRNVRLPLLEAFDLPDMVAPCPARAVSTFAPQALILLNGPFMQEQSKAFAARLLHDAGDARTQVERAYRLAVARAPKPSEREMALTFLADQTELLRDRLRANMPVGVPDDTPEGVDPAAAAALADFCLALLNRNEFLYID
jgi:hypothetical protein